MKSLTALSLISGGDNFEAPLVTVFSPGLVSGTGIQGYVEYKGKNMFGDDKLRISGVDYDVAPANRGWDTCYKVYGAGAGVGLICAPFVLAASLAFVALASSRGFR